MMIARLNKGEIEEYIRPKEIPRNSAGISASPIFVAWHSAARCAMERSSDVIAEIDYPIAHTVVRGATIFVVILFRRLLHYPCRVAYPHDPSSIRGAIVRTHVSVHC